jgi:hypothetical protein
MGTTYDIFKRTPEDMPVWVESINGLEALKGRLIHLASTKPDEYLVYDQGAQRFIDPFGDLRESVPTK